MVSRRLEWRDAGGLVADAAARGASRCPGHPTLVTGSNTHVAWGFTNTLGRLRATSSCSRSIRWTPTGTRRRGAGGASTITTRDDRGGGRKPVSTRRALDHLGPCARHRSQGPAARLRLDGALGRAAERIGPAARGGADVEEAFDAANALGTPAQNMVVADRSGRIGWTIYGTLPRRIALDGRLPESWADGWRGWNGWLTPAEYPRIVDPPGGRLWTANARVVDGSHAGAARRRQLRRRGARARNPRSAARARAVLRRATCSTSSSTPRSTFLSRWRDLILRHLTPSTVAGDAARARFRDIVREGLDGRGVARFGGLPADAHVPRSGDRAGHVVRARRVLRGRPGLRLHAHPPPRGRHLEARDGAAGAPAQSALRLLDRPAHGVDRRAHPGGRWRTARATWRERSGPTTT